MNLPDAFVTNMKKILGDEYDTFMSSYEEQRYYGLRLNRLKDGKRIGASLPFETKSVPWCPDGCYFEEEVRPAKEALYSAGIYYIQEPSAMTAVEALAPEAGEWVIDLCAAPGGKTTQIASAMGDMGLVVTNDINTTRSKNLYKNVQMSGLKNVMVMNEDPKNLAAKWAGLFDRVLVDAPCSGEGMFRKEPKLVKSWEENGPEAFINVQREILASAHDLLKPGGTLVYSTCTYNLEENESNIKWFLDRYVSYDVAAIAEDLKISEGFLVDADERLKKCGRVWPHLHQGEGHFIAKMIKSTSDDFTESKKKKGKIEEGAYKILCEFLTEVGIESDYLPKERLNQVKDTIYLLPTQGPDDKGLNVWANGWMIGFIKKNRFEPAQAFAGGLKKEDIKNHIDYCNSDEDVYRYLRGETVSVEAGKGWHLVCVEGQGLGWGKVVNGRLKNKLHPGWLWR